MAAGFVIYDWHTFTVFTASGGLRYVGQCLYQMCRQGGYTSSDILLITVIAFAAAAFKHTANTHLLKFSVYQMAVFFPSD